MPVWLLLCGWIGQAAFAWRTLLQWLSSERAGRTVLPESFWGWSLVGAVMTLVYAIGRQDPIFVLGALATGFIFARNAVLGAKHRPDHPEERPTVWPLLLGTGVFGGLVAFDAWGPASVFSLGIPLAWSLMGFVGQALWSGRFFVQWVASERLRRSVLPPSFFWTGFWGSILLTAYALYREDWVNVAAQVLNPIPYGRNWLIHRRASEAPPVSMPVALPVDVEHDAHGDAGSPPPGATT